MKVKKATDSTITSVLNKLEKNNTSIASGKSRARVLEAIVKNATEALEQAQDLIKQAENNVTPMKKAKKKVKKARKAA